MSGNGTLNGGMGGDGGPTFGSLTAKGFPLDTLTLDELICVCAVSREWVVQRVEEGMLTADGERGGTWHFSSRAVWRVRRMHALERDFDAVPELAALAADLMEELERARARLRRAGLE